MRSPGHNAYGPGACRTGPRPRLASLLGPLLGSALLSACGAGTPPDVLLVSLDSVRADFLTFRDADTAPAMTRLAERGTVFQQALSGTSWTLPAHAQMFTGNPPGVHGTQFDTIRIDPLHATLPELLAARGYATLGFWTGWYLADEYGFARGFDVYASSMTIDPTANLALRSALEARGDAEDEIESLMKQVASHQDITSRQVLADATAALAEVPRERPVFLFAHFFDPHYDYVPPPPYDRMFDPDYAGDLDGRKYWDNPRVFDAEARERRISDRDLQHVRALYRGEIAWTDAAVGGLLELFERRRGLDHTLVIVTADHGEEFFEHGDRGHRQTLFDEVLRVPLLIAPPGAVRAELPETVTAQVTLSDLLPTVLDYAGAAAPAGVYGRSLRPWLEGHELAERPAVSSLLVRVLPPEGPPIHVLTQAVRTPQEKLVRVLTFHAGGRARLQGFARYDLAADPGERAPLVDPAGAELRRLWERFEDGLEPTRRTFAALPHSSAEERATSARERFAHDLGPLGYADGGEDRAGTAGDAPPAWLWSPTVRLDPPR